MFVTNHVLAGAAIGATCGKRPVVAFALGVASHVAMDLTPHWGCDPSDTDRFLTVAKRDGVLGLAATGTALAMGVPPRRALAAGIAGAALLDLNKPFEHFFGWSPFPKFVDRFHHAIQREVRELFTTEMVGGAVLALGASQVLVRQRRRRAV
ncbi:MAG: hypothetical protein JOZ99_10475 [Actinobacteria bacterium]|nr:hypothetical protein [Actinomycetota bacterium]